VKHDPEGSRLVCAFFERLGAGLVEHSTRAESELRAKHIEKLEEASCTLLRECAARGQRIEELEGAVQTEYAARGQRIADLETAYRAQQADRDEIARQHEAGGT